MMIDSIAIITKSRFISIRLSYLKGQYLEIKSKDIQFVSPASLIPHEKNMNKHKPEQIDRLCKLIEYQGFRVPLVVQAGTNKIVAGHGRHSAALKLNVKEIPVIYQEFDSEAQLYAFMVSDNAIAKDSWASIDEAMILENKDLLDGLDLDLLGIDDFELPEIKELDEANEDTIPENVETRSKLGDIWQLGEHRLMCGDSTDILQVEKLMNGDKADITFTSPPYNVGTLGYDNGLDKYKGKSDNKNQDEYFNFLTSFTNICLTKSDLMLFNNQFLSGNNKALGKYIGHYSDKIKEVFPWIKNTAPPNVNKGVFTNRFEFILCLENNNTKRGFDVSWQGKYHNIIDGHTAAKENVTEGKHSATMPTYVPLWFIERLDFIKSIYDPFGGSGTTLIACEKTNRKCYMMELDPHYVDVILARWEKYTGKTATRLDTNTQTTET